MNISGYEKTLKELLALQWEYAAIVAGRGEMNSVDAVCSRTEFYSYSEFYRPDIAAADNMAWREKLQAMLSASTTDEAVAWYWPCAAPRVTMDFSEQQRQIGASFAGFMYEFHTRYFSSEPDLFLTLHFRNFFAPESPFSHTGELRSGLRKLLDDALTKRPQTLYYQCASWLNCRREFLNLFDDSYVQNSRDCYPDTGNTGWWGQFINAAGNFNQAAAERFRSNNWDFPYHNTMCVGKISDLVDHLS